jgi:hypothetical protein
MPDKKISQMDPDTSLDGSEVVPVVQGGNKRTTTGAIAGLAPGTNLTYDAATRLLSSSTGTDVTIPLVNTTAAGLIPHTWLTGEETAILPHIHGALAGVVYEHVRNVSGAPMAALTPYHVVGSQGDTDRVQIIPADASDPASMPASGILMTALANNEDGHGVIAGVPTGLNTAANPSGTVLYVGVGVLTPTAPAANVQALAIVGRSHASTGTLSMIGGTSLARVAYTGAYGDLIGLPTLGSAAAAATTDFAPASQGVNNGNSHNHDGGDGAQIAYGSLSGLPGNFTSSTAGLVPASGGGTTNFLRADGTFAAPPGGGGSPGGNSGEAQFNNAGAFGGATGLIIDPATGRLTLASFLAAASAPATPASAGFVLYAAPTTGALSWKGGNGFVSTLNTTGNTNDRAHQLQDKSGTLAHLDDVFDGYAVDNYIMPINTALASGNTSTANTIFLQPFIIARSIRINELACRVGTASPSSLFQLAIYNSFNRLPATVLIATTDMSGATATVLASSIAETTLQAGRLYWFACNTTASINFISPASSVSYTNYVIGAESLSVVSSGPTVSQWNRSLAQTYGQWPDLTGQTTVLSTGTRCPAPIFRVSALL